MSKITPIRKAAGDISEGILAGILISLGGAVFLACVQPETPYSRYIGAFLFSLALICICIRGYALYTGKIGLLFDRHKKDDVSLLLLCLLGNAAGTVVCGAVIGWMMPALRETANTLCTAKLAQGYGFGFLRAIFCGMLVYLSVDVYQNHGHSVIGIVFCIPAFILSGYEHSIADIFYFATAGIVAGDAFLYLVMILLGNSVGGLIIPALRMVRPKPEPVDTANAKPAEKIVPNEDAKPAEGTASDERSAEETEPDGGTQSL